MGPRQRPQGERPRSHLRRGAGGLRQGPLSTIDAHALARRLASVLPYPRLVAAGPDGPDLPWVWAEVWRAQVRDGADPTGPWRALLGASTEHQYGRPAPAAMPAAFVLQWFLEVAAVPAVYAAWHSAFVIDPLRAGLSFVLEPRQHYPVVVQLREVDVTPALVDDRLELAHAAYLRAATDFARSYRPEANLGRHQRMATVDDVWSMTLARARGQAPPARASCCFIYALPGVHECSGCPRLRRP